MRALRTGALLMAFCLAACGHAHNATVKPTVAAPTRPLVTIPGPAELPQYPVPALKPGTDVAAAQAPAATGSVTATPSQAPASSQPDAPAVPSTAEGGASSQPAASVVSTTTESTGNGQPAATAAPSTASAPTAPVEAPAAEYDPDRLVGLSEVDALNLLGAPVEKTESPPSRVWTYRSQTCDVKLFFYPEVGGTTYRTLTYEITDRDPADTTHGGCVGGLVKAHAG
jgi:hypothetical protein